MKLVHMTINNGSLSLRILKSNFSEKHKISLEMINFLACHLTEEHIFGTVPQS